MKKKAVIRDLFTPEGEALAADKKRIPWESYPRPHMRRDSYMCLNGEWDFSRGSFKEPVFDERIRVPFPPRSLLSGINDDLPVCVRVGYRRSFKLADGFIKGRVLLHIDAADRKTEVYINGDLVGEHIGGYDHFSFDVTDYLREDNILEIFVTDDHCDLTYPYGKQCKDRGGMWYTPVSGIWQTVWLESVPERYVSEIRVSSDLSGADVSVETVGGDGSGKAVLHLPDGDAEYPIVKGHVRIEPPSPVLWTPETPHLYNFTVLMGDDRVDSYFALRTVSIEKVGGSPRICLNGKPTFFHGLLDQGYFSDGIFLPAEPEGYERDILKAKELGFNMLRKHIKQEPELFYYACDRLGMIVFQDMINNGDYSFFRDTALPTVGFKKRRDQKMHKDAATRAEFLRSMELTVRSLSFHPSVCYWTIFNEGWGQFDHASAYKHLRELDSTRPIDSVSGWFTSPKGTVSDVESLHVYFKAVKVSPSERPTVLSEFGGYSYKIDEHSFNAANNYGYGSMRSGGELEKALESLYLEQIVPAIGNGLCGAVYTQLTDVEDETNGLMTYDRRVTKVSPKVMKALADKLFDEFERS